MPLFILDNYVRNFLFLKLTMKLSYFVLNLEPSSSLLKLICNGCIRTQLRTFKTGDMDLMSSKLVNVKITDKPIVARTVGKLKSLILHLATLKNR